MRLCLRLAGLALHGPLRKSGCASWASILPPDDDGPWFVVLGGINGAGKTTTAEPLGERVDLSDAIFLNPDFETARILAADPSLTQDGANFRGLRFVREEIDRLLAARASIVVETVFANQGYLRLLERAKVLGYGTRLLFFGSARVEQSVARVATRVAQGGHDVPEADIRRRWPLVHQNLTRAVSVADTVSVYASHVDGQPPRLIATAKAGRVTILDRDALPAVTAALDAAR